MFTTVVLALMLGVVVADVGLGYQYKTPVSLFGSSSYQINNYNSGFRNPAVFYGKGSSGFTGRLGQRLSGTSGSFGQGSGQDSASISQGSYVPASSGQSSSGVIGYNYNGLPSKLAVGSGFGSKSTDYGFNYNTFGNAGGASSGVSGSYNNVASSGLSSNYNVPGTPNLGSNSKYTFGSGGEIHYNIPNQQDTYQEPTVGQKEDTPLTTANTSGLDNIGSHYQAASTANQFISNQYQTSVIQNYQDYYNNIQKQPAQVFKHYYVHAAPEDVEPPKPRPSIILPPPQKHYKIIFIKAPTQQPSVPQVIPVPEQKEEKTIVYVLVKKPEEVKNIVLPKIEQKPPAKPDVFFIKYNNKQDSQTLIDNIVSDYNKGGVTASFSGSPGSLGGTSGSKIQTDSPLTSPSTGDTIFDYRFGSDSSSNTNTDTSNTGEQSSSSLSSGSSYTIGKNVGTKPVVSFGTAVSKPTSFGTSSGSSNSYSSENDSSLGANAGVFDTKSTTKGSSTLSSGPSTFVSGSSLTASNVGSTPSFANRYGSRGSGFSFGSRVTGQSVVSSEPKPILGSSTLMSGTVSTGTSPSGFGGNSGADPASSSINVNTVSSKPSGGSITSSNTGSGLSSSSSFSSGSDSYNSGLNSYGSESTSGSYSGTDGSGNKGFGVGSSKFDSGLGSGSSISESSFETSILSTSQGVPHETYGPPKFKVL